MNIAIAGGGDVGFHLARLLCSEKHDITLIEANPQKLSHIDNLLDVRTVQGNAASVMALQEADVSNADLFVAATGSDETNLIAAAAAKGLGARQVVARVQRPPYIDSGFLYETALGIDYVMSPEVLAAREIAAYVESPGIVATGDFGKGLVQIRHMRATKSPTVDGKTLKDVCTPGCGVLLAVITRGNTVLIPRGDTVVAPGDLVTLIGQRDRMAEFQKLFQASEYRPQTVCVMGGGVTGLHLAQALENKQRIVKLIERRMERCRELAAILKKAEVLHADATTRTALEQEHINAADVFIATTHDDERNILACVLAKEIGVDSTVAIVHQPDFAPLVARLGIDHAVTPRAFLANSVMRIVHQGQAASMMVLEEGQIEIVECSAEANAPIANKHLSDIRAKFPHEALVAVIQRESNVFVPSGSDVIRPGDSCTVIATPQSVEAAMKFFRA